MDHCIIYHFMDHRSVYPFMVHHIVHYALAHHIAYQLMVYPFSAQSLLPGQKITSIIWYLFSPLCPRTHTVLPCICANNGFSPPLSLSVHDYNCLLFVCHTLTGILEDRLCSKGRVTEEYHSPLRVKADTRSWIALSRVLPHLSLWSLVIANNKCSPKALAEPDIEE